MNQFGNPGNFPNPYPYPHPFQGNPAANPPAPFAWPSYAPVPAPTGPAPYPAMAPSYPPTIPSGYPGGASFPAPVAPPGYPGGAPLGSPAPNFTAPGGVPAFHMPDEEMVRASFREYQEEAERSGGSRAQYVKFPGPGGQPKWGNDVPVGYEVALQVYLLPAWASGKNIHRKVRSHFYKSHQHPRGSSLNCPGPESCLICKARDLGINSADMMMQTRAKDYGRVRTQFLYNVVILDNPHGHIDRSGVMRPFILGAGATLHGAIQNYIAERGLINIVHPLSGRPLRIKRRKTGSNEMDVEYSVVDMNPQPLPQYFYPALSALWDLDGEDKVATVEQQVRALQEIGLPIPAEAVGGSMGMPAVGAPMPPVGPNPYASPYQQNFAPQIGNWPLPGSSPGPAPAGSGFYPQQPVPPPGNFAQGFSGMQPPPPPPPPLPSQGFSGMPPPPPPPPLSPSMMGAPPMMPMPPPVQSTPLMSGNPYVPQPGPGGFPGIPPPPSPMSNVGVQVGGAIPYPVPAGMVLPGGRERCFGKCSAQDRYCQECIPDIREQCAGVAQQMQGSAQSAAPGIPPPPATGAPPSLEALSRQLRGG